MAETAMEASGPVERLSAVRLIAIVLDGEVLSAPLIRKRITGGSGQISGSFAVEEIRRLISGDRDEANFVCLAVDSVVEPASVGAGKGEQHRRGTASGGEIALAASVFRSGLRGPRG